MTFAEPSKSVMISDSGEFPSVSEICARVKDLGYATSERNRLYGEEFEVVSDPFPEANGIAGSHYNTKGLQCSCTSDSRDRVPECQCPAWHRLRRRGNGSTSKAL
jgi:hypothetical protein